ncbi:radical SAM protein [uncultured Roseibium sp.]|uniref:radical SAM protein n=1 Tax=uncultured Roseibium sp. TaxID=1936171 RepID=UPI00261EAAAD|nr:radical SAM protein [uncultured Roseibium sp.]
MHNEDANKIAAKFDIDAEVLQKDIYDLKVDLGKKGFNLNSDLVLDVTESIDDLSKVWTPTTPIIHIIQNCNSPCIMCDCWKTRHKVSHSLNALKPLFTDLADRGVHSLMISGGEPLMHPECRQIVQFVKSLGVRVELNTNGILLHKNMWVIEEDIDEIVVSMDATNRENYKLIRGADKFDLVWKNIQRIKETKPSQSIGARVTLTKDFLRDLQGSISHLLEKGVNFVGFSPLDQFSTSFSRSDNSVTNGTKLGEKLLPVEAELKAIRGELNEPTSKISCAVKTFYDRQEISWNVRNFVDCIDLYLGENNPKLRSADLCKFPFISLVLDYDGELKCCFYSKSFGNIYNYDQIDWTAKNTVADLHNSGKCRSCRGKVFCG